MVTVVPARYEHLPALRLLFSRLVAERGELLPSAYPVMDVDEFDQFVLLMAARIEGNDPAGACLVAESDGEKLVGFIAMQVAVRSLGKPHRFGFVDFLGVVEGARHLGIGRQLLDALFDWFEARGIVHFEANLTTGLGPDWIAYGGHRYQERAWITVDDARRGFLIPQAPAPVEAVVQASVTPPARIVVRRRSRKKLAVKSRPNGRDAEVTP